MKKKIFITLFIVCLAVGFLFWQQDYRDRRDRNIIDCEEYLRATSSFLSDIWIIKAGSKGFKRVETILVEGNEGFYTLSYDSDYDGNPVATIGFFDDEEIAPFWDEEEDIQYYYIAKKKQLSFVFSPQEGDSSIRHINYTLGWLRLHGNCDDRFGRNRIKIQKLNFKTYSKHRELLQELFF